MQRFPEEPLSNPRAPGVVLRAMIYYPMTNGRSIAEILRLVSALQTSDKYKVATPEG